MLLFLEIMLTISAWKKGWGWKTLIPVAIAAAIAFFGGIVIGVSGGTIANKGAFIIIDILLVITQGVMASIAPKQKEPGELLETSKSEPDLHHAESV